MQSNDIIVLLEDVVPVSCQPDVALRGPSVSAQRSSSKPGAIVDDEHYSEPDSPFAVSSGALVMMVDNEPLMLELVQGFLEEAGYRSFVITSQPSEAICLLQERRPDFLLLDLSMPTVSGFEILAQ